jgi:hypothetical protein
MLCEKALPLLSDFFDEVLDADTAVQVSQHLGQCIRCRRELDDLSALHAKLRSLNRVQAPEYLRRLVQHRLTNMHQDSWRVRLQNEGEYRWSKIRTTERMWYITRALGTAVASVFFFLVAHAISPLYFNGPGEEPRVLLSDYGQQVGKNVLARLGMLPPQKLYTHKIDPAVNDQCLSNFGESISQAGDDYDFSVVTSVDPSGLAQAKRVLEYPNADSFLNSFNKVVASARFAPAKMNGEAVPSYMVLIFSKVSVYD